jgi:hypothetical protein
MPDHTQRYPPQHHRDDVDRDCEETPGEDPDKATPRKRTVSAAACSPVPAQRYPTATKLTAPAKNPGKHSSNARPTTDQPKPNPLTPAKRYPTRRNANTALCPPNPNELLNARSPPLGNSRAIPVTTSSPIASSSSPTAPKVAGTTP